MMAADKFGQIMNRKLIALSGQYLAALREYLAQSPRATLRPAQGLGRQAVAIGLETLDLARMHERALAALEASGSQDGIIERADLFFAETISPIEQTHRAALKAGGQLQQMNKTLNRRTVDLAASNRSLKQGIVQRKTVEAALKKSGAHFKTLLAESLALQHKLQRITHQLLTAQESHRKEISHELQDEIAQTLLGINVRLVTVKEAAGRNAKSLRKEIAKTQQMVEKSAETIEQFAREFGKDHEA
jgi:signal transduction histidine kinase